MYPKDNMMKGRDVEVEEADDRLRNQEEANSDWPRERVCHTHERALPIQQNVEALDITEEGKWQHINRKINKKEVFQKDMLTDKLSQFTLLSMDSTRSENNRRKSRQVKNRINGNSLSLRLIFVYCRCRNTTVLLRASFPAFCRTSASHTLYL